LSPLAASVPFRVTDGARPPPEELVNYASAIVALRLRLKRGGANQPDSAFPQSPGIIFETPGTTLRLPPGLLLFRPASFHSFELISAHYSPVKPSTAKPLSCPFDFPDVLLDEVSFSIFRVFLSESVSHNQLFLVLSIRSCAVWQLKPKF
jgi:hypothetical protein